MTTPPVVSTYRHYLLALADLIGQAADLAWLPPDDAGWGGGFSLFDPQLADDEQRFGYCNTSDLLSDLEATIRDAAEEA